MFEGKIAIITGSGKGIGKEIALELAKGGAKCVINYASSAAGAEQTVNQIKEMGGDAYAYKCDVSDYAEVEKMMADVLEHYGRIDILVNNAGITKDNLMLKMTEEDFEAVIDINLKGAFNCMKAVTKPMMKQRYGRIINITSIVGVIGNAGQVNYSASKAGMIGMTKSAARELASRNITVNAVAPGFIQTDMTDVLSDAVKEQLLNQIPMKKLGQTSDIANAVCFLADEKASYITGQVLNVNGGMAM
ncbi:MAG: 3-oxoacyl-[acyl-carrier-protein] reductase [Lachnospiraceae bacterium]|nr:3-oxoacyl-[acyl-carrier-protein] reductase [Lachnospiraceae bacterium]